jgi:DNA-binding transcriptional regulator YhcF (GntR family)
MIELIKIDPNLRIPKYQQIVDSIIHNIKIGNIEIDEQMPSINVFSEEFIVSRDTVEKAYNILKQRNIISAIKGKGYFIARTKLISKTNILFLINKLSAYKMKIYNSFLETIGANTHVDLHIYHCDESLFLNLINKNKLAYDFYVIMPHFKNENLQHVSYTDKAFIALNSLPKDKVILMDNIKLPENKGFNAVYQDFENDIYVALNEGFEKISRYNKIILVYPEKAIYPYPRRILFGFKKFCETRNLDYEIIDVVYEDMVLKQGDLFITIEETDLVNLIKLVRENKYEVGKDVGIISYNDTPLKELFGITVASTDFKKMGELAAQMILNNETGQFKVPFYLIERNSIKECYVEYCKVV